MTILFDQDYAVTAYAREWEKIGEMRGIKEGKRQGIKEGKIQGIKEGKIQGIKEGKIQGIIEMCKDFGSSVKDTVQKLVEKFNLSEDEAASYVNEFWLEKGAK